MTGTARPEAQETGRSATATYTVKKSNTWRRSLAPSRLDLRRLILALTIASALIPFINTFYAGNTYTQGKAIFAMVKGVSDYVFETYYFENDTKFSAFVQGK